MVYGKELEKKILSKYETAGDVFSVEHDGEKVWVKKAKGSGSNIVHHIAYRLMKNPVLTPAKRYSATQSLNHEASKIKAIKQHFEYVPEIIYSNDDFMVMLDSGTDLRSLVKKGEKNESEMKEILNRALELLAALHNLGYYHGGSQIKNFTYKEDALCMIDFEEDFESNDIKSLQFRDLFLFLISTTRTSLEIDHKTFIQHYIELTSNEDFIDRFKLLLKQVSFVSKILDNDAILNKMGKDTKSVYRLIKKIEDL